VSVPKSRPGRLGPGSPERRVATEQVPRAPPSYPERVTSADKPDPAHPVDRLLSVIFERFARTGEWPVVDQLRHELDIADDDLDVMALGRGMDPNLGTVGLSHGDRGRLTIHGVARCPGSQEVLGDLLHAMQLAYERFRAYGTEATFGSDDLRIELGLSPVRIRRTYELMWPLPGIGGGAGASQESWKRDVTSDITAFKRVQTIEGLIAAAPAPPRSSQPEPEPVARPTTRASIAPSTTSAQPDALSGLHSRVIDVAGGLFRDGHYAQASFQAFKALEVALRERSGLDLSGRELAEKALGGSHPKVVLSRHAGRIGADEQEGLRFLFMGTMQGLRNPGGHELDVRDREEALEEIAIASLLMRWLDTSRVDATPLGPSRHSRSPSSPPSSRSDVPRASAPPRLIVLTELREISHRQARTSGILELDLAALAGSSGTPEERLQDALVDLLAEGLVEPNAPTFAKSAEQGACRITGPGLLELGRLTANERRPE